MRNRVLFVVSLMALSGCASLSELFEGGKEKEPVTPQVVEPNQDNNTYIELMGQLAESDEAGKSALYQTVSDNYIDDPSLANRLRFAMAVSTPGHHASDPVEARRILTDLLSKPRSLSEAELGIAASYLRSLETRLALEAEIKSLNQRLEEIKPQTQNNDAQLRAALAENQRLQAELDEAQSKLEALTSIERSIETTDNGNEP